MAIHLHKYHQWILPETKLEVNDGDVIERFNFTQEKPGTLIFAGKKNLLFKSGNLANCVLPVGCKHFDCLRIEFTIDRKEEFPAPVFIKKVEAEPMEKTEVAAKLELFKNERLENYLFSDFVTRAERVEFSNEKVRKSNGK